MKVSLNHIKKYIDLPKDLTAKQIAYDLTLRTVEVENVEDTSLKYHDIVVGKIIELRKHPNADKLKICITDIGEDKPVQIVCGGVNLYEGEYVVVSRPGAEVVWHGEGEAVKIKETKMRGEDSFGMICAASEVYLDGFFPAESEYEIVDLKGVDCTPGQNIAELVCMNDIVLEIDNKSLTNRPDLWGHYGIARELSAIYNLPLKELEEVSVDPSLPEYSVSIEEDEKCRRYIAVEIDGVHEKESPMWMKALLINSDMRPINAIVDITNYVMLAVGQPLHAFDKTHVDGRKIIVRNAHSNEKLLLLDNNEIELTEDDLVISDEKSALALAGIRGGKKDSILPDTTGILLEIANFSAATIRKTGKRFDEKTDSSIRYEKNIDTERVTLGRNMALLLIKEMFPDSKIISYKDSYPHKTERAKIELPKEFLDIRLGKELEVAEVEKVLTSLGYDVEFKDNIYHVLAPVFRSTGDVSLKDDVMGDIARILSYESFDEKPLPIKLEHAVFQNDVLLERRLKEYLSFRCGFNEIFTYPWINEKYIDAARIDKTNSIRLATPPAPSLATLRSSLVPGILEAIARNLRYYNSFRIYEMAQVFEKGEYHETCAEEVLPIHKKYLTGCIVGKDSKEVFYELKGVIEAMAEFTHMEKLTFTTREKPSWADVNAYLNIMCGEEEVGSIGLVSVAVMMDSKIKRSNVALFEIDFNKLKPFSSRTNSYDAIPVLPLVEKDLSLLVDEDITWQEIENTIKGKVKTVEFVEEYRGSQVPDGKKSVTLHIKFGNDEKTMDSNEINSKMNNIIKSLNRQCGAELREE